MISTTLARRYARALLELADSPMQREIFGRDLAAFLRAAANPIAGEGDETSLLSVLSFEIHKHSERRAVLDAVLRRMNLDATVIRFIQLVFDRGRIAGIPAMATAFTEMADLEANRIKATVTAARPLASDAVARIKTALERVTGKTITIDSKVDPELLGGVVTQVGTYVFDGSLRSQLERMRGSLRSESATRP